MNRKSLEKKKGTKLNVNLDAVVILKQLKENKVANNAQVTLAPVNIPISISVATQLVHSTYVLHLANSSNGRIVCRRLCLRMQTRAPRYSVGGCLVPVTRPTLTFVPMAIFWRTLHYLLASVTTCGPNKQQNTGTCSSAYTLLDSTKRITYRREVECSATSITASFSTLSVYFRFAQSNSRSRC